MKGYFIVARDELEEYGSSLPYTREQAEETLRGSFGSDGLVVIYGEIVPLVLGPEPDYEDSDYLAVLGSDAEEARRAH